MKRIFAAALALLLFAGASQAQTQTEQKPHHGHHAWMKQLNLTEDQKTKLKSLHAEQRKEMEGLKSSSLTADQMKAKREELHRKYSDQAQAIYTPEQKQQLEKMKADWKSKGGDRSKGKEAHRRFGEQLNLTQTQKDQLKKFHSESRSKFETVRNDQTLSDDQKKAKFKELRKEQHEQMKTVLTPEQLEKMKSMHKEHGSKNTK